ncbi:dihydrofolate reductase [Microbispora siamensis]
MIGLIWAQPANGVIDRDGTLPWRLPEDLKHFRSLIGGATPLMSRRTWELLPPQFRPLPSRRYLVLFHTPQEGVEAFPDTCRRRSLRRPGTCTARRCHSQTGQVRQPHLIEPQRGQAATGSGWSCSRSQGPNL